MTTLAHRSWRSDSLSCLKHVKRSIKDKGARGPRPPAPPAHIILEVVYDRSGSMKTIDRAARDGLLDFIKRHKKTASSSSAKTLFSLTTFDTRATTFYNGVDLATLPEFTHGQMVAMTRPRELTRLVDTLYERLLATNRRVTSIVATMTRAVRDLRPKIVAIVLAITDGLENASTLYTADNLKALVSRSKAKGIDVLFMGANQDAIKTASTFNIDSSHALTFGATPQTAAAAWRAATQNTLFAASGQGVAPQRSAAVATCSAPAFTQAQRSTSAAYRGGLPIDSDDDDDDDDNLSALPIYGAPPPRPQRIRHQSNCALGNMQGGGGGAMPSWGAATPRAPSFPLSALGALQAPSRPRRRRLNTVQAYNN